MLVGRVMKQTRKSDLIVLIHILHQGDLASVLALVLANLVHLILITTHELYLLL